MELHILHTCKWFLSWCKISQLQARFHWQKFSSFSTLQCTPLPAQILLQNARNLSIKCLTWGCRTREVLRKAISHSTNTVHKNYCQVSTEYYYIPDLDCSSAWLCSPSRNTSSLSWETRLERLSDRYSSAVGSEQMRRTSLQCSSLHAPKGVAPAQRTSATSPVFAARLDFSVASVRFWRVADRSSLLRIRWQKRRRNFCNFPMVNAFSSFGRVWGFYECHYVPRSRRAPPSILTLWCRLWFGGFSQFPVSIGIHAIMIKMFGRAPHSIENLLKLLHLLCPTSNHLPSNLKKFFQTFTSSYKKYVPPIVIVRI